MVDLESEFVRHINCDNCGSSDGNALYSDGHTHCFVCHQRTYENDSTPVMTTNHKASYKGYAVAIKSRNISEAFAEKFKIYRNGDELRFHYHDDNGQVIGAKKKTADKVFTYEGETDGRFFGQHLWRSKGKQIIITEGEIDCVSVAQAMGTWETVSLPNGAAAAKKSIQKNFEWLQGFEKVVLFFDNDEPGQKAAKEAADVLPPGKAFIARLDQYKDASDALKARDITAITQAVWNATPYRPDGIVDAKNLLNVITTPTPPSDYDYPYRGLNDKLHGIRLGELVAVTAGSGTGKSSFCRDICSHLLQKGERVGYLALEESNRRTALGLMSPVVGKSLHLGEPTAKELIEAFDQTIAKWNLFLFDGFGSYDPDVIYNRIEYLASGLDCKVIFLDHLSILLSGLDGDERRMIDQTMTRLRSLVERTGITLFLVSHLKRNNGDKNHEEGARVTLGQLRGSASIAQLSDCCIALERDQQSDNQAGGTTVRVLKNRFSGETGVACHLQYDLDTCKFNETEADEPFDPTTDF